MIPRYTITCTVLVSAILVTLQFATAESLASCNDNTPYVIQPSQLSSSPYNEWAHHHWVWLSAERANQTSMIAFAKEWLAHNIPVGAVDLDSGWSTEFNDFCWNPNKYPDPKGMVDTFHSMGMRVITWIVSVVNADIPSWQMLDKNGWLIKNGIGQSGIVKWWHGKGSFIDYFHPDALSWWHQQLDRILAIGIDGWKTDGTDPYIMEFVNPISHRGPISYRDYANAYYGDFFDYSRTKNPDALIMSRPCDDNAIEGIYLNMSPRRVVWSGWVGDNHGDFPGLQRALRRMFFSSYFAYPNFGSDIAGYLGSTRTRELFLRWSQMGAFCPLMENGGNGEHRPWLYDTPSDNSTTDTYRTLVGAHMQLVAYLMTTGVQAFESNRSSIEPFARPPLSFAKTNGINIAHGSYEDDNAWPSRFDYMLGNDFYVVPIVDANVTSKIIHFPAEPKGWVSFWDARATYAGGSTANVTCGITIIPVYHRVSTIIPLLVINDIIPSFGDQYSSDSLTLLINRPMKGTNGTRQIRDQANGIEVNYDWTNDELILSSSGRSSCKNNGTHTIASGNGSSWSRSNHIWLLHGIDTTMMMMNDIIITQRSSNINQPVISFVAAQSSHHLSRLAATGQASYYIDIANDRMFIRPVNIDNGVMMHITGVISLPI